MNRTEHLHVTNLPIPTEREKLKEFFSQFGHVLYCFVSKDKHRLQSCYALMTLEYEPNVPSLLNDGPLLCFGGRLLRLFKRTIRSSRKIFIAGTRNLDEMSLRSYFIHYGIVKDVVFDRRNRTFAFLEFADDYSAEYVVRQRFFIIRGKNIVVEKYKRYSDRRRHRNYQNEKGNGQLSSVTTNYPVFTNHSDNVNYEADNRFRWIPYVHNREHFPAPAPSSHYNIVTCGHDGFNTVNIFYAHNHAWMDVVGHGWTQYFSP